GTGVVPSVPPTVSVSQLNFGDQEIGLSSAVQSIGVTSQNGDAISAQLQSPGNFTITPNAACSTGSSGCQLGITFSPSVAGSISSVLTVTDIKNSLSASITLAGNGYGNTGAMAGLAYYLPFRDGSGSTIHDGSGNNDDATISGSGTAAVWQSGAGLQLNGQVAVLPNSSGLPTFGYCAYFPAATATAYTTYVFDVSYFAAGKEGYNLGTSYGVGTNHGYLAYFPQIGRSNGAGSTLS